MIYDYSTREQLSLQNMNVLKIQVFFSTLLTLVQQAIARSFSSKYLQDIREKLLNVSLCIQPFIPKTF